MKSERRQTRETPDRRGFAAALPTAIVGIVAFAFARFLGPGEAASPDSCHYISAAQHLAAGHGFVTSTVAFGEGRFSPVTAFAPGFPAMLAAPIAAGVAPLTSASWVLSFAFVAYAVAMLLLFRVALGSWAQWAPLFVVPIAIAPGVLEALNRALSDLPSAAIAVAAVVVAIHPRTDSRRSQLALGALLGLAALTRWANLYLAAPILAVAGARAIAERPLPEWGRTALRLLLPLGVLVGLAWTRNRSVSGTFMGNRPVAMTSPTGHSAAAFAGMTEWFTAAHGELWFTVAGVIVGTGALLLSGSSRSWAARTLWAVALGYPALMILSASVTPYDPLDRARFWLFWYPVAAAAMLVSLREARGSRALRLVFAFAWMGIALHATYRSGKDLYAKRTSMHRREGYFSDSYAKSAAIRSAIGRFDAGSCQLVTNDTRVLLPQVGLRPVAGLPEDVSALRTARKPSCLVLVAKNALPSNTRPKYDAIRRAVVTKLRSRAPEPDIRDALAELWLIPAS